MAKVKKEKKPAKRVRKNSTEDIANKLGEYNKILSQLWGGLSDAISALDKRNEERNSLRAHIGDAILVELLQQMQLKEAPVSNEQKYQRFLFVLESAIKEYIRMKQATSEDKDLEHLREIERIVNGNIFKLDIPT